MVFALRIEVRAKRTSIAAVHILIDASSDRQAPHRIAFSPILFRAELRLHDRLILHGSLCIREVLHGLGFKDDRIDDDVDDLSGGWKMPVCYL